MAGPKAARGRNATVEVGANTGPGTAFVPKDTFTVTEFSVDELGTEDDHQYVGSQGMQPDKDVSGYGGSFTLEMRSTVWNDLEHQIAERQYNNQEDLEIRISAGLEYQDGSSSTRTFTDCVLKFGTNVSSRSDFVKMSVAWRSGGLPTKLNT